MKRCFSFSNSEHEASDRWQRTRKKIFQSDFETLELRYSSNDKKKKKSEHSNFFDERSFLRPFKNPIWERDVDAVRLELPKIHKFIIPAFKGNINDAKQYCEIIINEYKKRKLIFRESAYKKKRKRREKKISKINIDNKNIPLALELRKEGYGYDYISRKTLLSISQIKNAVYKESLGLKPFIVGRGPPPKLNDDHLKYLMRILKGGDGEQIFSYIELKENLVNNFDDLKLRPPSLSTVIKYTKKKLRFSKKKGSLRFVDANSQEFKRMRVELILKILSLKDFNKEFIFIDETRFNIDMTRSKGISEINTKFLLKKQNKGENISAVCAISKNSLIGVQLFKGGVKGLDFGCFLINLINNNEQIKRDLDKYVFFMDNCSIHKSKKIKKLTGKLNILFNVPYSCDLNPIENIFGIVKKKFRSINGEDGKNIETKILNSFKYLSSINIEWCVLHSYNFYLKSLKMEDI